MSGESQKKPFAEGYKSFQQPNFDGVLRSLDQVKCQILLEILSSVAGLKLKRQSIRFTYDRLFVLYDTRASVYEALSCSNHALRDAQKTIELDPTQWHGYIYFRSARLL